MKYRLWDTDVGRLIGTYDSDAEPLALVRTFQSTYGADYAENLTLSCERDDGSFGDPLSGAELAARAEQVAAEKDCAETRRGEVIGSRRPRGG